MKKKIVWLVVSCLMALSLVVASCGPAEVEEEEEEEEEVIEEEEEEVVVEEEEEEVEPSPTVPQYGGWLNIFTFSDPMGFDETFTIHFMANTLKLTNEELLTGDWARGPAGTGEFTWGIMGNILLGAKTGSVAESWEIIEPGHIVFNIRQGVHWALNPDSEASRLVNGRELTADDVVWTLKRYTTETTSYIRQMAAGMCATVEITAPDKWTVDIKCPREEFVWVLSYLPDFASIMPPEVTETYGDMRDWHNNVGTGSFMMTDYVPSSSMTFERNPNYWGTDPVGPGKGQQLPYLDGVKMMILADLSTRLAAFRTGKLDVMGGLGYDTANEVRSTTTGPLSISHIPESGSMIFIRTDKEELPFKDKRVRQALIMAIDYNTIINELYGGDAILLSWPVTPVPEYIDAYLPLEECPDSVKELYTYNPDKAKQLLTEAGYPNGFKTQIVCGNAAVDYLSTINAMWSQVNVDLEIQPLEAGQLNSIKRFKNFDEMLFYINASVGTYIRMLNYDGPGPDNGSYVDDPYVREVRDQMFEAWYNGDEATVNEIHKGLMPYVLEKAWVIPSPLQKPNTFWWPWLKGYHGESSPGNNNSNMWSKYVWIDQALKQSMGY